MIEIWPSLISADLLDLKRIMNELGPYCAGFHIDIMDNHFVPNLTWGAQFANAIAAHSNKPVWVHLMIDAPDRFLDKLTIPKESYVTFHAETKTDINRLIDAITKRGWRASIAVNPETCIDTVYPFLDRVEQVLIMSVNPGFSGQKLIPETLNKILPLAHTLKLKKLNIPIAIDGGINRNNIAHVHNLGVSQFGVASGIFDAHAPKEELKQLYALCQK